MANRLGSGLFENMASVLISRLNPGVRRIDGSGGDGGRDLILPTPVGVEIFELKSFTERMTSKRRTQVKRSLARAAKHSPTRWNLLVPIDPTPAEEKWFEALTTKYPFPCDWFGLTWLDEKIAACPDIPRYFLGGTADEVIRLLAQVGQEQAGLARGAPDAIDRLMCLMAQVNELNPFYRITMTSDGEQVTVSAAPRYEGAELDCRRRCNRL